MSVFVLQQALTCNTKHYYLSIFFTILMQLSFCQIEFMLFFYAYLVVALIRCGDFLLVSVLCFFSLSCLWAVSQFHFNHI